MRSKIEEYNAVVEAASKFTKSVAEGNSKYAKELFTEDACLFGFLNGKFERGSIEYCLCNQFGYVSLIEHLTFDRGKIIEV